MAPGTISHAPSQALPQLLEASYRTPAANSGCGCPSCQDNVLQVVSSSGASALPRIDRKDGKGGPTIPIPDQGRLSSIREGPSPAVVVITTRKGGHDHQHHRYHKPAARHHSRHSRKAGRHPKKIGEVVRADGEKKKYDARAIVDDWEWECEYAA